MIRHSTFKQLKYILKYACSEGEATTFHLNEHVIEFCKKFYPNKEFSKARGILRDRYNYLVKIGILHPPVRRGCYGCYGEFGVKTITIYRVRKEYVKDYEKAIAVIEKQRRCGNDC